MYILLYKTRDVYDIMESFSFRKIAKMDNGIIKRGPINKALFEAWCTIVHNLSYREMLKLIRRKEELLDVIIRIYDDRAFQGYLRSSDIGSIKRRIERIKISVTDILGG